MEWYYILLIVIASIIVLNIILLFLLSFICYRLTFYVNRKKHKENDIPLGEDYEKYRPIIEKYMNEAKSKPYEDFFIKSYDGLKLHGMYFKTYDNAPIEILFHGYRGNAFRDMSAGIERAAKVGRNALIVDQRTTGLSDGKVITFGMKERYDCVSWINFVIEYFGDDIQIYIGGVSMGGSTVLLASSMNLPKNVKGILADSSFYSAKDIINKVLKDMKLPTKFFYPFIKLGAKLYGNFNLEETTPLESVKSTNIPIIFYHGEKDTFVPYEMSVKLYMECKAKKKIVTIKEAEHGICYLVEPDKYVNELLSFINE